jgi:polypyrimidine tract-binding protein 2
VLHVRNLPPDATEQEIMQLCKPFGRVVRIRLNAGAIKHQAFVEFENVNNAMQMIYSFVGSADPPKVQPCSTTTPTPRMVHFLDELQP